MDLVAGELARSLSGNALAVRPVMLRPTLHRRFSRLPLVSRHRQAGIVDRLLGRYWDYPRWLPHQAPCDVYHIVDHSYAHLVERLPRERTVVTCHDIDAFRCLAVPASGPPSRVLRALARRTWSGLREAARVVCVSDAVRRELEALDGVEPSRISVIPNGLHAAFGSNPDPAGDLEVERRLGVSDASAPQILHVGSAIPRKRIDVLLRAFAAIRAEFPRARLVRLGGLTVEQRSLARQLGVEQNVVELPFLETRVVPAVYRRAAVVLVTSEREGFGLPVIEALASGVPVIASDIPALRETGGSAAVYCRVGDSDAFAEAAIRAIAEGPGDRRSAVAHAAAFAWRTQASRLASLYRELV